LSVDAGPAVTVTPGASIEGSHTAFALRAEGGEIVLRFRPRFYAKHRGLGFFEPWTYQPWPSSVAGWISWFAFFDAITEQDVVETAAVFSEALKPFGYEYFQIDDGYQQIQGGPEKWLNPNAKFPKGLKYLADFIKSRGLKPGLWTAASCLDLSYAAAHPQWFVRDAAGRPVTGNWVGAVLDASNPEALVNVVRPLYQGLMDMGWQYIKLENMSRPSARPSGETRSSWPAGAPGPSLSGWPTPAASATTASPTPDWPNTTPSTTSSGVTIPITSSSTPTAGARRWSRH
jgi:hypothetical protein